MSGYFARLAQRSGDAAPARAPHATPASSAFDAAPASEEIGVELERNETIEAQPSASPAITPMPTVLASSAAAAEPPAPAPGIAPSAPARQVVEEVAQYRQAESPRQAIGQPDRSAISARTHRYATAPDRATPPRVQPAAAPPSSNPSAATPRSAYAAAPPNGARMEAAAREPHAPAPIEMHQTVDPTPRIQAETVARGALPDTRERVREARIDPAPRARIRAEATHSAAASLPRAGTSPSPTPSPVRGGVEVSIGRIEMEIIAAPPPPRPAVSAAPPRAPRPAPAFNPRRHYLRGG